MTTSDNAICDFCGAQALAGIYAPSDTNRAAKVSVCERCGLVQTVYGLISYERHSPSISSGAGWGNIRHGKGLRLDANKELLERYVPDSGSRILDIGANRGDFIDWLSVARPNASIYAIEPDTTLHHLYQSNSKVSIIGDRLEQLVLENESYDFVFCLHTLEHAASARGMLQQARNSLRRDGYMLVEIPDLELINDDLIVEDFFIDKHSYHFDDSTLRRCFAAVGLKVVDQLPSDGRNLNYVLQVCDPSEMQMDTEVSQVNIANIRRYVSTLELNRSRLANVAQQISTMSQRQRVGIWGASRIFDALVRFGGLKTEGLLVIDDYLAGKVERLHGAAINRSSILRVEKPQVLFVLAKGSANQIEKLARSFGVKNIVTFDDMLSQLA